MKTKMIFTAAVAVLMACSRHGNVANESDEKSGITSHPGMTSANSETSRDTRKDTLEKPKGNSQNWGVAGNTGTPAKPVGTSTTTNNGSAGAMKSGGMTTTSTPQ